MEEDGHNNKTANLYVKNYRLNTIIVYDSYNKSTCNDDAGIGQRKQQNLAYRIFTM